MTYFEGIIVSKNHKVNVSAAGAELEKGIMKMRIYRPSDTAKNLENYNKFTFSLTADPDLFYKAALRGQNDPKIQELDDEELVRNNEFLYPEKASIVYFCKIKDREEISEKDKFGEVKILEIKAEIIDKKGSGDYIQRENPLVDAMVYATRKHVADEGQIEKIIEKVKNLLKDEEGELASKIIAYVEGTK